MMGMPAVLCEVACVALCRRGIFWVCSLGVDTLFCLQVRTGNTNDDEEDYSIPVWAGVVPLKLTPGVPIPDPRLDSALENAIPEYVLPYHRPVEMAP